MSNNLRSVRPTGRYIIVAQKGAFRTPYIRNTARAALHGKGETA